MKVIVNFFASIIIITSMVLSVVAWNLFVNTIDRLPINQTTKTCLVTGASSGIGYEISRNMAKKGWTVIGIARREEKLKKLADELGNSFVPFVCDVSVMSQIKNISEEIKNRQLKPTLFFLNAGTAYKETKFKPFLKNHKQTFDTNYFGAIAWVEEWINRVKEFGGGMFVAISSVAALFSGPGSSGYGASKAALKKCFQSLRLQYRDDNIGFVVVLPGPVKTEMLKVDKPIPFTHQPDEEARYIVKQVFKGKKQIEPSWFYSFMLRILNWMPDILVLKIFK